MTLQDHFAQPCHDTRSASNGLSQDESRIKIAMSKCPTSPKELYTSPVLQHPETPLRGFQKPLRDLWATV